MIFRDYLASMNFLRVFVSKFVKFLHNPGIFLFEWLTWLRPQIFYFGVFGGISTVAVNDFINNFIYDQLIYQKWAHSRGSLISDYLIYNVQRFSLNDSQRNNIHIHIALVENISLTHTSGKYFSHHYVDIFAKSWSTLKSGIWTKAFIGLRSNEPLIAILRSKNARLLWKCKKKISRLKIQTLPASFSASRNSHALKYPLLSTSCFRKICFGKRKTRISCSLIEVNNHVKSMKCWI